jgi:hypothetical protein
MKKGRQTTQIGVIRNTIPFLRAFPISEIRIEIGNGV